MTLTESLDSFYVLADAAMAIGIMALLFYVGRRIVGRVVGSSGSSGNDREDRFETDGWKDN